MSNTTWEITLGPRGVGTNSIIKDGKDITSEVVSITVSPQLVKAIADSGFTLARIEMPR